MRHGTPVSFICWRISTNFGKRNVYNIADRKNIFLLDRKEKKYETDESNLIGVQN